MKIVHVGLLVVCVCLGLLCVLILKGSPKDKHEAREDSPSVDRVRPRAPLSNANSSRAIAPTSGASDQGRNALEAFIESSRGTPSKMFQAEPRDQSWAPVMEKRIEAQITKDLAIMVPDARVIAVSCHTNTCKTDIELPIDGNKSALMGALQVAPRGDENTIERIEPVVLKDGTRKLAVSMYDFFNENRDPEKELAVYETARRDALTRLVAGQGRARNLKELPRP